MYKVNGKAMRMRDTFVLEDPTGAEVAKIQERKMHVRDTMAIERDGKKIAEVHKRLVGFRDRLKVDLDGGDELTVKGKLGDHEYTIKGEHGKVAEISKKWFRVRDTYGIDIEPDQDDALHHRHHGGRRLAQRGGGLAVSFVSTSSARAGAPPQPSPARSPGTRTAGPSC